MDTPVPSRTPTTPTVTATPTPTPPVCTYGSPKWENGAWKCPPRPDPPEGCGKYGNPECLAKADYVSLPGDSGAPVFARVMGSSTDVILVGVHNAGESDGASQEIALFVPIDRIYAEALLNGYEWELPALRPLPVLDDNQTESLTIDRSDGSAVAVFDGPDFSTSRGIVYDVGLFQRKNGRWAATPFRRRIGVRGGTKVVTVSFASGAIPADASVTDFKVRVRMNAKLVSGITATDKLDHFSAWGPDSTVTPLSTTSTGSERVALAGISGVTTGKSRELGISASGLATTSGYALELSSSANAGFDSDCKILSKSMAVPEKADSFTDTVNIYGCTKGQAEFKAELKRDGQMVARARTRIQVSPPPTPILSITPGAAITEGGMASFTIAASPVPASPITVRVGVSESGSFGAGGAATISVSGASAAYAIATTDDSTDEPDGTVTATLQDGSGYTVSPTAGTATVSVADNDDPAPAVSIKGPVSSVRRGNTAWFTVKLGQATERDVTVSYKVGYVPSGGNLVRCDSYYPGVDRDPGPGYDRHTDCPGDPDKTFSITIPAGRTEGRIGVWLPANGWVQGFPQLSVTLTALDGVKLTGLLPIAVAAIRR